MAHHVASTEQEIPLSPFRGGFRPVGGLIRPEPATNGPAAPAPPRDPVPKGTLHAVVDRGNRTVCGLDVASLYDFPEVPWPPTRPVRCLLCRQWVETGVSDSF